MFKFLFGESKSLEEVEVKVEVEVKNFLEERKPRSEVMKQIRDKQLETIVPDLIIESIFPGYGEYPYEVKVDEWEAFLEQHPEMEEYYERTSSYKYGEYTSSYLKLGQRDIVVDKIYADMKQALLEHIGEGE